MGVIYVSYQWFDFGTCSNFYLIVSGRLVYCVLQIFEGNRLDLGSLFCTLVFIVHFFPSHCESLISCVQCNKSSNTYVCLHYFTWDILVFVVKHAGSTGAWSAYIHEWFLWFIWFLQCIIIIDFFYLFIYFKLTLYWLNYLLNKKFTYLMTLNLVSK